MRTPLLVSGLVICVATLAGGQGATPSLGSDLSLEQCWWDSATPDEPRAACAQHRDRVMSLWRDHGSYYALLEIVEGRLESGLGKVRREDVIDFLGTRRIDWEYPHSRRDGFLVWSSSRSVPMGSHLAVQFDAQGIEQSYEWVSE